MSIASCAAALTSLVTLSGCADPLPFQRQTGPILYGSDDRAEYYEVAEASGRDALFLATVALIAKTRIQTIGGARTIVAPTWTETGRLCPNERFGDQPAAAFCTGVLVDHDLVLTAGHCVRQLALDDFSIVFGYHHVAPGKLAAELDVSNPIEIVAEALDSQGVEPRLDYAWLRLARPAPSLFRPAPVHITMPSLRSDEGILALGTGGGVPIKWDQGGRIRNARPSWWDYFVADTDTSHGSSGGPAFVVADQALLGILVRGEPDLIDTDAGCAITRREPDGAKAGEEYTYAHQAVAALCARSSTASSLCRASCGSPCQALPPPVGPAKGGCALAGDDLRDSRSNVLVLLLTLSVCGARRESSRRMEVS